MAAHPTKAIPCFAASQVSAAELQRIGVDANHPFILRGSCSRWIEKVLRLPLPPPAAAAASAGEQACSHESDEAALAAVERLLRSPRDPHAAGEVSDGSDDGEAAADKRQTLLNNVFVVPRSVGRRFKYFRRAVPGETVGTRQAMSFDQLLQHLPWRRRSRVGKCRGDEEALRRSSAEDGRSPAAGDDAGEQKDFAPAAAAAATSTGKHVQTPGVAAAEEEDVFVYVYGEPSASAQAQLGVPCPALDPSAVVPDHEDQPKSRPDGQSTAVAWSTGFTSTLIWIALDGSLSPLHYDACEGFLHQLHGSKSVTLISPAPSHFRELQPHPVGSTYDRQSRFDSLETIPEELRSRLVFWEGELGPGDTLYIPYGWWHEVRSTGVSISVSQRWDPAAEAVRALSLARQRLGASLPPPLVAMMYEQAVEQDPRLPAAVRQLLLNRSRQASAEAEDGGAETIPTVEE